jgi:carotenoid cleavage dioxygenase-like enzyme
VTLTIVSCVQYDSCSYHAYLLHKLPGNYAGEAIFVPASAQAAEGEGYLLTYVYVSSEDRSEVAILDAMHIAAEPLATIKLPQRVSYTFHGLWTDDVFI